MMTAPNDTGSAEQALREMLEELLRQPERGGGGHAPVSDEQFERLLGLLQQTGIPASSDKR